LKPPLPLRLGKVALEHVLELPYRMSSTRLAKAGREFGGDYLLIYDEPDQLVLVGEGK